ncbi:undecaprenyldiphospho-muramoylpentapeptide beta-N-acetylglucosaminyltransferase [Mycoplasmatota bacterium]|nr:undecaprenyldiphospho-muramoylpentapeptide beta-N-acetylglucosaminyltransferase [Mycoplasmatota bacterium]
MKIIFSGGGTGGHIYPAIALIKALKKKEPTTEILYIGKKLAQEEKICKNESISFIGIKVRYFYRKLTFKNILTIIEFIKSYCEVKKIIKQFKPDIIIGTGGYVCAPVVYAGARKKIKTIIHEQNSIPGLTNKFLSHYADKIAISFSSSEQYFNHQKTVLTGNPRAQEVVMSKKIPKNQLKLQENKKLILIFMGSLGAKYVNQSIVKSLPILSKREDIEVIFVTGKSHYDTIISEVKDFKLKQNVFIKDYVENMPQLYQHADLVICRAGATTLAEISAIGIPSILIPSPYVTNNHQEKNALDLVQIGGAVMIKEKDLSEEILTNQILKIIDDPYQLQVLRINNKKLGIPNACDKFIELIEHLT